MDFKKSLALKRPLTKKEQDEHFEALVTRAIPSSVPVHTTKASYKRMLDHCHMEGHVWGCSKTGARINARMVISNIFERATGQLKDVAPVVTLYCPACETVPDTHKGQAVWDDEIQTLAM